MQEFPQGADRAAGRFGFAETHGLRPWRRRRAPPGLRPGPCPPAAPCRAQAFSLRPRPPARFCCTAGNRCVPFSRGGTPPPARFCRTAGLRPAGQTVLRTVLGGAGRRRPCGPPSPCRLPGTPTPKRPPERRALLSVSIPPSARPPAPPQSFSRCPPASPAAAPSGRAKTPPYPSRRCGSARIPSGSRCKAATHCAE